MMTVGEIEIFADAATISQVFIRGILARMIGLAVEFLLLATALAFIFYRTITRPLVSVAEQLGAIDPHGANLASLETTPDHKRDELGFLVDRCNELLNRIGQQQVDLIHREKVAALGSMLAEVAPRVE